MPSKRQVPEQIAFGPHHPELDEVNLRILAALHRDPRLSMSALARAVGLSAPTVTQRVRRMEEAGIITGFSMLVDPAALGLPVTGLVRVRPGPGQLPKLIELAQSHPQVSACDRITGEDCVILRVHAATVEGLEGVLDRLLLFGQTTTSIVVSQPVAPRPLPLPEIGAFDPTTGRTGRS
ncbi:Lrp/AsnC family transcriptional regulator [Flexivirga oryzae]|uniref:Lrp/AsnC family leucine-responsive transcriptional regulator n=1 Tax=Flexivirga oryzae TaxID=1794944 RepID=A0A839NDN3_9MICO|nr:Lrp/AsnC family transcriptional regulator [Flexivirga oryzae]MBB2894074.1 Lrp/AsnC family leucine-responsive transcriptional regulator [Flexivirga oryzae]